MSRGSVYTGTSDWTGVQADCGRMNAHTLRTERLWPLADIQLYSLPGTTRRTLRPVMARLPMAAAEAAQMAGGSRGALHPLARPQSFNTA